MRKLRLTPRLLAGTIALAAVVLGVFYWGNSAPAGSAFTYTAEQRSRYLAEMKENLNGHPESPRYDLVSEQVLVSEGVVACEWLATQPSGDSALTNDELRHLYFQEHPQATAGWPFGHGHTGLREEVLTNSWGWLCEDVEQDHRADPGACGRRLTRPLYAADGSRMCRAACTVLKPGVACARGHPSGNRG